MDALTTPLPKDWQRVRLGDIAEIKRGVRITKNELDVFGKYPVVSGGVGFLGYTNNFNRYENTITIAQYGTAGYVNFQKNKFWANDICFCVYPNKDVIKNIFLYYFLKVNQNYLYEISNRNATPYSISKDKILDFEILLPPLNEQIAIANILSDVDRYLYSLDALILKKESVKKALSFELLSQRKRLKGFNQAWQKVRLGDIGKPCMCKRVMKHQTTPYGEIPFYKIGTFGNTADAFISKKLFLEYKTKYSFPKKGDILISASGTIGRAVIYDGKPAYFQDSNIVWIDNDETLVKNDFLFYAYSNIKWNTEYTTILRLYNDNFRNTLIPLPPPKRTNRYR
ncbi:restriction endonuclease subunit S [Helicobacter pylori]